MGRSIPKANPLPDDVPMNSDSWCTPPEISVPLERFWGYADLDPCSNDRSIIKAHTAYTELGLMLPWKRKTWQNHPYSTNEPWADKAIYEMRIGNVEELVVLCMLAASTGWWQKFMVKPRRNPRVICTKRIKFIGPDRVQMDSSRFEPVLIYYGKHVAKFDREFKGVAMWSTWGR
jgi:hypothetical protein